MIKIVDTTLWQPPVIGGVKERWLFQCSGCRYKAIFILWRNEGMSTSCERCRGDMQRVRIIEIKEATMNKEMALELLKKVDEDYGYFEERDGGWKKALYWMSWFLEWLYEEGYEITPKKEK